MDFSYEYTQQQTEFRSQVSQWVNDHVPKDFDTLIEGPRGDAELIALTKQLGSHGWLAPAAPYEDGGAGLSPDLTVVLLEELNRRGLLSLVDGETQSLRAAIDRWGPEAGRTRLARSLATGEITAWRHRIAVSPGPGGSVEVDPDSVGVSAKPDADGYVLNGSGLFTGHGAHPGLLWTVALIDHDDAPSAPVCLIVDAAAMGVYIPPVRSLASAAPRSVRFDDVWVLRTDTLGPEGEGHRVVNTRVSLDPRADLPSWVETETDALVQYAGSNGLGNDPVRAKVLVEAYIASRVARLLRLRSAWLDLNGQDSAIGQATASLWRSSAAAALSSAAQEVVGPTALLSSDDPRAPDGGRFDRLSRRELAERTAGHTGDADRAALASNLELDSQSD